MKDERAHLQLFDLIARDWSLPSSASEITFSADSGAVAFASADGGVHLAATADTAAPGQRIRRALDTGRLTIAPRVKPFAPLRQADHTTGRSSRVVALGPSGFAFAKDSGRINALTPGGIATHLPVRAPGAITALAASTDGAMLAYACEGQVWLVPVKGERPQSLGAFEAIADLGFSSDGRRLAVAHAAGLCLLSVAAPEQPPHHLPLPGPATALIWRDDGAWIAARLETGGFCVIDAGSRQVTVHENFPAPVRSIGFNARTGSVLASGAFRVVAWALPDHHDLMTGKSGLVLVDALATSPDRNLVAVGYGNGLLSLAEIGRPTEMLLREDTGAGVTAMAWSGNGAYLAVAGTDGSAALVEFPDAMFKS